MFQAASRLEITKLKFDNLYYLKPVLNCKIIFSYLRRTSEACRLQVLMGGGGEKTNWGQSW